MELEERLSWLAGLAERMGVAVRFERLGGEGGGLCTLKSQRMLFVDLDADPRTRYESTLVALGGLPELRDYHLPPVIAEDLERLTAEDAG